MRRRRQSSAWISLIPYTLQGCSSETPPLHVRSFLLSLSWHVFKTPPCLCFISFLDACQVNFSHHSFISFFLFFLPLDSFDHSCVTVWVGFVSFQGNFEVSLFQTPHPVISFSVYIPLLRFPFYNTSHVRLIPLQCHACFESFRKSECRLFQEIFVGYYYTNQVTSSQHELLVNLYFVT